MLKNFLEAYVLDKNRAFKVVDDFSVAKGHLSKLVNNILDSDELQYWKATVDEIKNENPQWNWNQLDFDDFISKVSYENIKKAVLAERVETVSYTHLFWFTIIFQNVSAYCVTLMFYQIVGLCIGEVAFNFWTVVAFVLLAGVLYLLFRKDPNKATVKSTSFAASNV